jgi:serine phosphatase RsbU (regulator of sigma subunit)
VGKSNINTKATTIFRQLILNIILPVVLAIIALAIYNNYSRTTAFKKFYHEKNQLVAYFIQNTLQQQDIALAIEEDNLDIRLEELSDSIVNFYMPGTRVDSMDLDEIQKSLGMNPVQEDIFIIDNNGVVVNTTFEPDLHMNVYDFGDDFRKYLENVQLADSFRSEKFTIENSTKKLRKFTYQPTKDGKYIVELGVYSVSANEVVESTKEILLDISSENRSIRKVDLFIGADPPFSFDSKADMSSDSVIIQNVFNKNQSISFEKAEDNGNLNYEYIYMKREDTELYKGAVIRIISDYSEDKAFVTRSLLNSILIFLITITVVIVLIYKKSKVITNPIKKLLNNVNRITAGNLNERADVEGNNEIARLSEKFNVMVIRLEDHYKNLEQKVKDRTAEISQKAAEIAEKNKDIEDSIRYAKRIQNAILPPNDFLKELFPASFILYKPKDIVSGDFYWSHRDEDNHMFAVVDCTGHGVPGAFMSIVGNDQLNYAVNVKGANNPGDIMNYLNEGVRQALRQRSGESAVRDGMDMTLISINYKTKKLNYAGAFNPVYVFREGELIELAVDRCAVGGFIDEDLFQFENREFDLLENDMIYIFSDGYVDQFGGPRGKKLKPKRFRAVLESVHKSKLDDQKEMLDQSILDWMGELEQVDDILLAGFKI